MLQSVADFSPVAPVDLWSFCFSSCREGPSVWVAVSPSPLRYTYAFASDSCDIPPQGKAVVRHSRPDRTVRYGGNLSFPVQIEAHKLMELF